MNKKVNYEDVWREYQNAVETFRYSTSIPYDYESLAYDFHLERFRLAVKDKQKLLNKLFKEDIEKLEKTLINNQLNNQEEAQ